jgi:hypothetical protein
MTGVVIAEKRTGRETSEVKFAERFDQRIESQAVISSGRGPMISSERAARLGREAFPELACVDDTGRVRAALTESAFGLRRVWS